MTLHHKITDGIWNVAEDGAIRSHDKIPDDYSFHMNWPADEPPPRGLEGLHLVVSWPFRPLGETGPISYPKVAEAELVGLYYKRPAKKWRDLVTRLGCDNAEFYGDDLADFLEENIERIIETARDA